MENVNSIKLEELKSNGEKVLVDFWAKWCGPCRQLIPRLEIIEKKYENIKFIKIDIDENMDYVLDLGIRSVPTVMIFNGNELVTSITGVHPDSRYEDILNSL